MTISVIDRVASVPCVYSNRRFDSNIEIAIFDILEAIGP